MAAVTKLHLCTFQKDQHFCFKEQKRSWFKVKRGCFVGLPVLTRNRRGAYVQKCRSFRGGDGEEVEQKEMESERKLGIWTEKGDGFWKSLKSAVFGVSKFGSQSQDEYEKAVAKVEEVFSSIAMQIGRYIVTMMSTGVILLTGFQLSGGDSQMNTLIWYSWVGGIIIGTMIGANMVLDEHCRAGPRNVVITGSTRGLGKALAREYLLSGDRVVVASRSPESVDMTVKELEENLKEGMTAGGLSSKNLERAKVVGIACDVCEANDVEKLAKFAVSELGSIDIWINNAGTNKGFRPLLQFSDEDIKQIVSTNLVGSILCTREAMRIMKNQPKGGHIFNMDGAGSGGSSTPLTAVYGSTKCGLRQLHASLLKECKRSKVGIHTASPGMVLTDLLLSGSTLKNKQMFNLTLCEAKTVRATKRGRKMYGDCEAISSMGGNMVVSSETLFTSTFQNPNFTYLPLEPLPPMIPKEENGSLLRGKEEMKSGSESELQETTEQPLKKKRYHRHTAHQIQELEAVFKECPHPDDKQRMKLSQELGLKPRQVKFWFQNRRTQMKAQQDRSENAILRAENESLKSEFYRLQAELSKLVCPNCGGPPVPGGVSFDELRIENARLGEELERVCAIASRYIGRPIQTMGALMPPSLELDMNIYPRQFLEPMPPILSETPSYPDNNNLILMEEEKTIAMELAMSAADELVKMCRTNEPLWVRNNETGKEVLNLDEHSRMFHWPLNLKQRSSEFRTEASRDSSVVIMNSITLVDAFVDANKWMELFPSIVARAKCVQVISQGVSGTNGCLQLMYAELHVLSPLVPTREAYFLRYCQQQNVEDETYWAIVDFPLDGFHNSLQTSFPLYKRRPSGCLIQDMPNGYSRVTWVEHAEMEEKPIHQIFSHFVHSGMAFGANRWLAVLERQCERIASLMATNIPDIGVIPSPEARKNLMRLSQRMIRTFCVNISSCSGQVWTAVPDSSDDTVRITTRKVSEAGQPNGLILCAVSTTWLPYPHHHVFDLLRDERRRAQLEVLSNGNALHEVAHIANGSHPGNCISLLRINVASNSSQHVDLMLQESCTDKSGSLVVYSTVDVDSVQLAMSGEDPSCIPLLPLGFFITPMELMNDGGCKDEANGHNITTGSLLTVGLQVLASTIPSAKINLSSIAAINNHLCTTVQQISSALSSNCIGSCNEGVNGKEK